MSIEDRNLVLGALDSLAMALSQHGHKWTDGERAIYELATAALGRPTQTGNDDGEEWKKG